MDALAPILALPAYISRMSPVFGAMDMYALNRMDTNVNQETSFFEENSMEHSVMVQWMAMM